ncbi:MAG: HK97 gp10 family phage protein [Clostridium sp.]|uniref:HK97 gp10 family phage protein n=1 Tax=Clostridium sp. TaxID=1506 RepID=UPI002580E20F|nr:HK97 gp10 family phage protein [Clostridium sp.]MBS6888627.1 HK97 gp10 family phage protein [Clostridium sp.]
MAKSKIKGISNEFAKILSEYKDEIVKGIEKEKEIVSKKAVKRLRETSPEGSTKRYKKGWRVSDINGKKIVHNKTDYQKTHLLEYGHAKVNGGRVAAKPHIRPVEEQVIKDFTEGVGKVIKR